MCRCLFLSLRNLSLLPYFTHHIKTVSESLEVGGGGGSEKSSVIKTGTGLYTECVIWVVLRVVVVDIDVSNYYQFLLFTVFESFMIKMCRGTVL